MKQPRSWANALLIAGETERARREYELAEEQGQDTRGSLLILTYARRLGLEADEAAALAEGVARRMGLASFSEWPVVGEAIVTGDRTGEAIAVLDRSPGLLQRDEYALRLQLGQLEETIAYLQEMQRAGAGDLWRIGVYPEFDPLREDPRFIEIVESLGVPNGYDPAADR